MASFDQNNASTIGSGSTGMGGAMRTLSAFFDSRTDAEEAVSRLRSLGLPESSIRMVGDDSSSGSTSSMSSTSSTSSTSSSSSYGDENKGFWDSLADFFFPDEDRATYAEGLRRGGYLVTVSNISDDMYDQALDILDDEGSVDVDSRSNEWRNEGWTGASSYASGTSGSGSTGFGSGGNMGMGSAAAGAALGGGSSGYDSGSSTEGSFTGTRSTGDMSATGMGAAGMGSSGMGTSGSSSHAGSTDTGMRGDTEVIPVVEENLRIGKRDVNLGRVRVRSYVVEQPVQEQVNLREERVSIERRPVDRALTGTENAFTDRVIEAEEHAEQAVVAKEARVKEEIAVRKESEQHTETVSDTVRRTEVEVEDERTTGGVTGQSRINEDRNR